MRWERGQASVELLGALPALLLLGAFLLQLLAVGYSAVLAGNAAEAAALAAAGGGEAREAARGALPGWAGARMHVTSRHGEIELKLRPPSLLPFLERRLQISARAAVKQ